MRFDVHTHTTYSDGLNSVEELVSHGKKQGLDGIAITDHNTVDGALKAMKLSDKQFIVVPGIEVSALEGHILVLGVKENIPRKLPAAEVIDRAHALGGIAVAAHPYDFFRGGVGDLIKCLRFDGVEVCNGRTLLEKRNSLKIADEFHLPKVGGSDAHSLKELGSVTISFDGDLFDAIRTKKIIIESKVNKLSLITETLRRRFIRLLR